MVQFTLSVQCYWFHLHEFHSIYYVYLDCTSQYVLGIEDSISKPSGVYEAGLQCVLVLIGVHCLDTGLPVMGIVNQPFHKKATEKKFVDLSDYC